MPAQPIGQQVAVRHAGPPDLDRAAPPARRRTRTATSSPDSSATAGASAGMITSRRRPSPVSTATAPVEVVAPQLERLDHRPNGSEARNDLR